MFYIQCVSFLPRKKNSQFNLLRNKFFHSTESAMFDFKVLVEI